MFVFFYGDNRKKKRSKFSQKIYSTKILDKIEIKIFAEKQIGKTTFLIFSTNILEKNKDKVATEYILRRFNVKKESELS